MHSSRLAGVGLCAVLALHVASGAAQDNDGTATPAVPAAQQDQKDPDMSFLDENRNKEGVVVRDSGLQYKVLKEGSGKSPGPADRVKVHYRGRLVDGTEFDSSYARNEPLTLGVNQVIPGWTEALQLMQAGDQWELYIPAELGYGARGAGGVIPPNATLIFEVELIEVL